MEFLGLSVWFWMILWVVCCVGTVLFFMGASAQGKAADAEGYLWEHYDTPSGPLGELILLPVREGPVTLLEVPEFKPIIDGCERGWVS